MPTGCRSVYLRRCQTTFPICATCEARPAGDLEGRAKDLRSYEFRHLVAATTVFL